MNTSLFSSSNAAFIVQSRQKLSENDLAKLEWLLEASRVGAESLEGNFIGPRREMVSPWSTNATEIALNSGVQGVVRIESFRLATEEGSLDPMLEARYEKLGAQTLVVDAEPEKGFAVENIAAFNEQEGLALSAEEISFLNEQSEKLGRPFTDSELFAFGQINSEHCRHKIFNGTFVVNGEEQDKSLFAHIKDTSKHSPENIVSAYSDNVAFLKGPTIKQFAPDTGSKAGTFKVREIDSVVALKAETHNFPTTVEPFNGASTGSGGEIRDRMGGGTGGIPLTGSAVYMTAYPRLGGDHNRKWEKKTTARNWKYQSPSEILIKASNGASDFGNKFGQPVNVGSVITFEGQSERAFYGYDRTIMLAGGVGYANSKHALKHKPKKGDKIVVLGGDNYRIGMAGGSVSSVDTGAVASELELSAVQRANPEMQKRAFNVVRALAESENNPIRSIHDHGAGGHVNCLSELLEPEGGVIDLDALPVGDSTLSHREILCNESQERMGLLVPSDSIDELKLISERERSPMYVAGEITGDKEIIFRSRSGEEPVSLPLDVLFGSAPKTVLTDKDVLPGTKDPEYGKNLNGDKLLNHLCDVLSLEGVACKDWLTNKVDRSVTGRVALQQCAGPLQLALNDCGVAALDYSTHSGISSSIGHASVPGIIDERAGSILSVAEAATNCVFVLLEDGLSSLSLSANWMWPCKQPGEDVRLYRGVEALSKFCMELGIPVPTGKDSLSMTMRYDSGEEVRAPGTVVVSASGVVSDIRKTVTADLKPVEDSHLLVIDFSGLASDPLGGSAFFQTLAAIGEEAPTVADSTYFKTAFNTVQKLVADELIIAGHDVSGGGLLTAACEMAFAGDVGINFSIANASTGVIERAFSEKPGVVVQVEQSKLAAVSSILEKAGVSFEQIGSVRDDAEICVSINGVSFERSLFELRRVWFEPSARLELLQTRSEQAKERELTFEDNPLAFVYPNGFTGKAADYGIDLERTKESGLRAAIIREKGTNGDREMAFSMFAAGFDVKDIAMRDLMNGSETLDDVNFVVFPGGFSNSDVLGAARGWAGAFRFNENAMGALKRFYERDDTLSLGVCNGCQLMVAMELLYSDHSKLPRMEHNASGKFESIFLAVDVEENNSVMLKGLAGSRLGIWVAHGEGKFVLPMGDEAYHIPMRYVDDTYPANPNGSDYNAAALCSPDGRHLVMMPHLERAALTWQWPYCSEREHRAHEISPWMLAFVEARKWVASKR